MTHVNEWFLLNCSLSLNGMWLGIGIVQWVGESVARLRTATLTLLSIFVLLAALAFLVTAHSTLYALDRAASSVVTTCCLWCACTLSARLPRPWGHASRQHPIERR
jgi:hypothetical protein